MVDTPLDRRYSEAFGFTKGEVSELLAYAGCTDKADEARDWYDDYCFGGEPTRSQTESVAADIQT